MAALPPRCSLQRPALRIDSFLQVIFSEIPKLFRFIGGGLASLDVSALCNGVRVTDSLKYSLCFCIAAKGNKNAVGRKKTRVRRRREVDRI